MNFSRRLLFGRSVALRRSGNAAILALGETEFFGQINPAESANPIIHTSAFPKQHLFQTACGHHVYAGAGCFEPRAQLQRLPTHVAIWRSKALRGVGRWGASLSAV
jgi:hypothetical protein